MSEATVTPYQQLEEVWRGNADRVVQCTGPIGAFGVVDFPGIGKLRLYAAIPGDEDTDRAWFEVLPYYSPNSGISVLDSPGSPFTSSGQTVVKRFLAAILASAPA